MKQFYSEMEQRLLDLRYKEQAIKVRIEQLKERRRKLQKRQELLERILLPLKQS